MFSNSEAESACLPVLTTPLRSHHLHTGSWEQATKQNMPEIVYNYSYLFNCVQKWSIVFVFVKTKQNKKTKVFVFVIMTVSSLYDFTCWKHKTCVICLVTLRRQCFKNNSNRDLEKEIASARWAGSSWETRVQ